MLRRPSCRRNGNPPGGALEPVENARQTATGHLPCHLPVPRARGRAHGERSNRRRRVFAGPDVRISRSDDSGRRGGGESARRGSHPDRSPGAGPEKHRAGREANGSTAQGGSEGRLHPGLPSRDRHHRRRLAPGDVRALDEDPGHRTNVATERQSPRGKNPRPQGKSRARLHGDLIDRDFARFRLAPRRGFAGIRGSPLAAAGQVQIAVASIRSGPAPLGARATSPSGRAWPSGL